jgi:hypothetical protein
VESRSSEVVSSPVPPILLRTTTSRCLRMYELRYKIHVFIYIERAQRRRPVHRSQSAPVANSPTTTSAIQHQLAHDQDRLQPPTCINFYLLGGYLHTPISISSGYLEAFPDTNPYYFHGQDWFASLCPGRIRLPAPKFPFVSLAVRPLLRSQQQKLRSEVPRPIPLAGFPSLDGNG